MNLDTASKLLDKDGHIVELKDHTVGITYGDHGRIDPNYIHMIILSQDKFGQKYDFSYDEITKVSPSAETGYLNEHVMPYLDQYGNVDDRHGLLRSLDIPWSQKIVENTFDNAVIRESIGGKESDTFQSDSGILILDCKDAYTNDILKALHDHRSDINYDLGETIGCEETNRQGVFPSDPIKHANGTSIPVLFTGFGDMTRTQAYVRDAININLSGYEDVYSINAETYYASKTQTDTMLQRYANECMHLPDVDKSGMRTTLDTNLCSEPLTKQTDLQME